MKESRNTASKRFRFLKEADTAPLKKHMAAAGGYAAFMDKWMEKDLGNPIPTQNSYYNVLNGRSKKKDVFLVIKEIVEASIKEMKEFKTTLTEDQI